MTRERTQKRDYRTEDASELQRQLRERDNEIDATVRRARGVVGETVAVATPLARLRPGALHLINRSCSATLPASDKRTLGASVMVAAVGGTVTIVDSGSGELKSGPATISSPGFAFLVADGYGGWWAEDFAPASGSVTLAMLAPGSASGQSVIWNGSAWVLQGIATGPALTDADESLQISSGSRFVQTATRAANRTKTLLGTGAANGDVLVIEIYSTDAFTVDVEDGPSSTVIFTLPASQKRSASFRFDGTNWEFMGSMLLV